MKYLGFILFFLLFSRLAHAQLNEVSGITHGAEFEFTSDWIYEIDSPSATGRPRGREKIAARRMAKIVKAKCQTLGCTVEVVPNGKWGREYRVTTASGWWFKISYDPLCVEIQTKPATLHELYSVQPLMEDLIFESSRSAGLEVRPARATHLNIGARSAFGYDVRSLFNYLIDNANHPEFSSGLFRENWNTAPPLAALGVDPTEAVSQIHHLIGTKQITSFASLAEVVAQKLHHVHPNSNRFYSYYNQDLSFHKLKSLSAESAAEAAGEIDMPIERRGVRALKSFQEFVLHAEISEKRIAWIKSRNEFIPFTFSHPNLSSKASAKLYFQNWLAEIQLPLQRYQPLIDDALIERSAKFNQCRLYYSR